MVLAVLAVLGFAASKPSTFRVARQAVIKAPPDKVLALLQDFREWAKWSPWEKLDPNLTRTMSGAASGKGAIYAVERQQEGRPGPHGDHRRDAVAVDIDLEFMAPWKAKNMTVFTLTPARWRHRKSTGP